MISPSSMPADRYIAVTPVSLQWFRIDHCTGPAPRSSGRMLACMLMQPYFGISSTRCGRIFPYATTIMRSGANARSCSITASSLNVCGCTTGSPTETAYAFTSEGISFIPRFLGVSGFV